MKFNLKDGFAVGGSAMKVNDEYKLVVYTAERVYVSCTADGIKYKELFNDIEPFNFFAHIFMIPSEVFEKNDVFLLEAESRHRVGEVSAYFKNTDDIGVIAVSKIIIKMYDEDTAIDSAYSGIDILCTNMYSISKGAFYTIYDCADSVGAPVKAYSLTVNPYVVDIAVGTPFDSNVFDGRIQTVMEQALCVEANGKNVIGAINGDFFDMFGNNMPAGLCIKSGVVLANGTSTRPYFAIKKNNMPYIGLLKDYPKAINSIRHAISGVYRVLSCGKPYEFGLLDPFAMVRHPRTAVGITKEGSVVLVVVDGRAPEHSTGMTLVDLAVFMRDIGVYDALNLDGGGSSTFIVKNRHENLVRMNSPRDIEHPEIEAERPVYNTLIVSGLPRDEKKGNNI